MPSSDPTHAAPAGRVGLTFDDGPDEAGTGPILEELGRLEVQGTFFMVGERVRSHPRLARAVIEAGHDVQLHCWRHVRHTELEGPQIERDTSEGILALAGLGVSPTRWRTPWGVTTRDTLRLARRYGLQLTGWTIDTHDWRGDPAAAMLGGAQERLTPGAVVLMHDGLGPGARREDATNTVELLAPLLEAARKRGLAAGPLARGFACRG